MSSISFVVAAVLANTIETPGPFISLEELPEILQRFNDTLSSFLVEMTLIWMNLWGLQACIFSNVYIIILGEGSSEMYAIVI